MTEYESPVERFRSILETAIEALESSFENRRTRYCLSVLNGLLQDYNRIFRFVSYEATESIDKYCYSSPSQCPICGSQLVTRHGKFGSFYGCSQYPQCKGIRKLDRQPAMNEALRNFLESKEKEDKDNIKASKNRFSRLEL
jgi:hypothetical protein